MNRIFFRKVGHTKLLLSISLPTNRSPRAFYAENRPLPVVTSNDAPTSPVIAYGSAWLRSEILNQFVTRIGDIAIYACIAIIIANMLNIAIAIYQMLQLQ